MAAGAEVQLFYDDLIAGYVGARDYVSRDWLQREVLDRLANPACRYVLITGEPRCGQIRVDGGACARPSGVAALLPSP
jgi:hypothetical protein